MLCFCNCLLFRVSLGIAVHVLVLLLPLLIVVVLIFAKAMIAKMLQDTFIVQYNDFHSPKTSHTDLVPQVLWFVVSAVVNHTPSTLSRCSKNEPSWLGCWEWKVQVKTRVNAVRPSCQHSGGISGRFREFMLLYSCDAKLSYFVSNKTGKRD